MIDWKNGARYDIKVVLDDAVCVSIVFVIRYTQTAVASFGALKLSECGRKPAGFTRLTPEVLDWVKKTAGLYHPGINDPGEGL